MYTRSSKLLLRTEFQLCRYSSVPTALRNRPPSLVSARRPGTLLLLCCSPRVVRSFLGAVCTLARVGLRALPNGCDVGCHTMPNGPRWAGRSTPTLPRQPRKAQGLGTGGSCTPQRLRFLQEGGTRARLPHMLERCQPRVRCRETKAAISSGRPRHAARRRCSSGSKAAVR